ncbi:MAG TPA: hypothetical protein VJL87_03505, partial [Bdellovibrionota bacterium]|nr:hypothetical protein [Bdellovibrionota bacterium]
YLATPMGGAIYLHALLEACEREAKSIDLCVPDLRWFFRYAEEQERKGRPFLEIEGIALEIYWKGQYIPLTQGKKKVRLLSPSSLSFSDFRRLIACSKEFMAIRGNQSFSEAVSMNKMFFYDGKEHTRYFVKDLMALAENRLGAYPSTLEVFRAMRSSLLFSLPVAEEREWVEDFNFYEKEHWRQVASRIGKALQDPDCLSGFQKFNRIVAEEYAANDFLCDALIRELCHRADPSLKQAEDGALDLFATGVLSLKEAMELLKKRSGTVK